jgi:hypothetical protein
MPARRDIDTGKAVLRDDINATTGFEGLSRILTGRARAHACVRANREPPASNLFAVLRYLQGLEGIHLAVKARKAARGAL